MCIGEKEFNLGKWELMKSIMGTVLMKKIIEIQLLPIGDMVGGLEKQEIGKITTWVV